MLGECDIEPCSICGRHYIEYTLEVVNGLYVCRTCLEDRPRDGRKEQENKKD